MSSKLKKLKDLERILTVTIPLEDYKDKFQSKINNIKGQAKLDGFRKGKVPNDVLEQKYGTSIHADVVNDLIQASYPEALKENNLRPASSPTVKLESEDPSKPLVYSATFEIFPDIKPKVSSWTKYETFSINISDEDVNLAIEDICKRYGEWNDVDRESAKDDQVIIDFKGSINGEEFEGNSAADFKLVLGSNSMIPGFEDELIGKSKSEFKINAKFPDDYFKKEDYLNSSKYYEQAIDYNQDNYIIYENLAISYDLSKRTDMALEMYDLVLNNFKPNNGRVEFYKGLLLVRLGENELGCNYLRESSNKNYVGSNTKIRASEVFAALCINN